MKFYIFPILTIIILAPALTSAVCCYYSDDCSDKLVKRVYADDGFVPRGLGEVTIESRALLEDTAVCCCIAFEGECNIVCVSRVTITRILNAKNLPPDLTFW